MLRTLLSLMALCSLTPAHAQPCQPRWSDEFPTADLGGYGGSGAWLITHDAGQGPQLFIGGTFTDAGGSDARGFARWDGSRWTGYRGLTGYTSNGGFVRCAALFDDGTGPRLYVGGRFWTGDNNFFGLARWEGDTWTHFGPGLNHLTALAVFDDGSGPALYAAGAMRVDGVVHVVSRFDGSTWTGLAQRPSTGFNEITSMAVYDDGSGPALYAGGWFTSLGGLAVQNVARWRGGQWQPVGPGLPFTNSNVTPCVRELSVLDLGEGPALYAAGGFFAAGDTPTVCARWDGQQWLPMGSFFRWEPWYLNELEVFDDGAGPALHAAGYLPGNDQVDSVCLARWDGTQWVALAGPDGGPGFGQGHISDLLAFDDGNGPALLAAGGFSSLYDLSGVAVLGARGVAKWDGTRWRDLVTGGGLFPGWILHPGHDELGRPVLEAYGGLRRDPYRSGFLRFDGSGWARLDIPSPGLVSDFLWFDDGTGPALYAAGGFGSLGGYGVARFRPGPGAQWETLRLDPLPNRHGPLAVYDDGTGPRLYAAWAGALHRWTGSGWEDIPESFGSTIYSLAVFDDGTGPGLYVGGESETRGHIARLDANGWHDVGGGVAPGLGSGLYPYVYALTVWDNGSGPALYAGGTFGTAGGVPANRVARWDGSAWSALGGGLGEHVRAVLALSGFDDGSGPQLAAAGDFRISDGGPADYLARWDGRSWTDLGGSLGGAGPDPSPYAGSLGAFGADLFVTGEFSRAGGHSSGSIARWIGCRGCRPDCDGSGALSLNDFVCFRNRFVAGDPAADFDQDGVITLSDFTAFRDRYAAGCR